MSIKIYKPTEYGASADGKTICTKEIQKAVDDAAKTGECVILDKGIYLTGSVFIKSNVEFRIEEGAELRGIMDEESYPDVWSRVAGVEMKWPAGLLNVINEKNVKITGKGLINGQGEYWWNKYWGKDKKGGMRKNYESKDLRWLVDYDCKRPRNIIIWDSSYVLLENLTIIKSPFWNVHVCYSENINIKGLIIKENEGPSTDGIDIDSSRNILVEKCYIECNDDNICIKSGRDADGLRVNRPCENVTIKDCETGLGEGITIGSETSGGVKNIEIWNIRANKTTNGIRLKSAKTRGGVIKDIKIHNINMIDVPNPFIFNLNWNPSYSYCEIPKDYKAPIPEYWKVLSTPVSSELGIPEFRDIQISNVNVSNSVVAFKVDSFKEKPIKNLEFKNVKIKSIRAGYIKNAKNWKMTDVSLSIEDKEQVKLENCINVELPQIV